MITASEAEYAAFKRAVAPLLPVRLDDYKQEQMERRIRDLARKHGAATLARFVEMVRADRDLRHALEQHITINVSELYRNPAAFDLLNARVLPRLLAAGRPLRLWSAGCSYGAEPYTLGMLLLEQPPGLTHHVYATDINRAMLERARRGADFSPEDIRHLPSRLRDRYIKPGGPPYAVTPEVMRLARFERFNLLEDRVAERFDLIACRNVVIYFTDEAKIRLYRKFVDALHPGGYLFVGATEVVGAATSVGLRYVAPCFYQKAA